MNDQTSENSAPRIRVPLETPIKRGETEVTEVFVRLPEGGALDGISIRDAIDMEGATMRLLLSRVTEPPLLKSELQAMPGNDFVALAAEASNFLLPRRIRADSPPA